MVLEARVVHMLLPLLHQVLSHYDENCCRTMPVVKECGVRDLLTEITKICLSVVKSILPQWNMITMNLQTSLNVMLFILTPMGHRMYWHGDSVWHGRHGVTCLGIFSLIKPVTMVKLIFPTQIHSHVVIFYTALYSLYLSNGCVSFITYPHKVSNVFICMTQKAEYIRILCSQSEDLLSMTHIHHSFLFLRLLEYICWFQGTLSMSLVWDGRDQPSVVVIVSMEHCCARTW